LPEAGTSVRIIIADDHAIFRDGLRRLLASEKDFEVIAEAADGKDAVLLTQQLKPDILLLDLAMPRVPGMEALRELAQAKVPVHVILLTAAIHPFEVTCALQLGARGVVLKASPPEMLLKSIRAVSEGQYWVASDVLADWARITKTPSGASGLTPREVEIISGIRAGSSNREIAIKLAISEETVKRHLSNIFGKLGVSSRLELALLANHHNLGR
jgi:two-component system, NarL family, nitrate/nitrite response regulator NarL